MKYNKCSRDVINNMCLILMIFDETSKVCMPIRRVDEDFKHRYSVHQLESLIRAILSFSSNMLCDASLQMTH